MQVDSFHSFTLTILLLFIGKGLVARINFLRAYSIPESLVGGLLCAVATCIIFYGMGLTINFDLQLRDVLLLYFFAGIGLNTDIRSLASGGRPLVVLTALSVCFMVLQNVTGMGLAQVFGLDPRAGLMLGSISLTGGVGTTLSWTEFFTDTLGIANAKELGLAANTIGLISACVIGGPIAAALIGKYKLTPSDNVELEVGSMHKEEKVARIDYYGVLMALFWLNMALILGSFINEGLAKSPVVLPEFVGCLVAGIVIRALGTLSTLQRQGRMWRWPIMQPGLALISDICLGGFITMALMGLQLWTLQPVLGFMLVCMLIQVALVVLYIFVVVFRVMGKDYESAVMCAGFGGITLGSTATAIANMTAVTQQYGAAHRAFIVVPLVCGFFIDLANALVIGVMVNFTP